MKILFTGTITGKSKLLARLVGNKAEVHYLTDTSNLRTEIIKAHRQGRAFDVICTEGATGAEQISHIPLPTPEPKVVSTDSLRAILKREFNKMVDDIFNKTLIN